MLTVITGAGGFVGQAVVRRMAETGYAGDVRLVDRTPVEPPSAGFESLAADLTDPTGLAAAIAGADRVIHLAALPGGAAERAPRASRRINLETALDLAAALAASGRRARLVNASSIAVFGAPLPETIDDDTAPTPRSTYGGHKLMAEIGLADADRRGGLSALSLRLPGIVARPRGATGFGSAFMSDVFSALAAGEPLTVPVGPEASLWLMSAACCADNLIHAATCDLPGDRRRALTLPALRVSVGDLVAAIAGAVGQSPELVSFSRDPAIEAAFGRQPPLVTPAADAHGFRHDGDLDRLVRSALNDITLSNKDMAA